MLREGFGIHLIVVLRYLGVSSRQQSIPNSSCIDGRGALRKAYVGQGPSGSMASAGRGKNQRGFTARLFICEQISATTSITG